jgi:hypothetical protein
VGPMAARGCDSRLTNQQARNAGWKNCHCITICQYSNNTTNKWPNSPTRTFTWIYVVFAFVRSARDSA